MLVLPCSVVSGDMLGLGVPRTPCILPEPSLSWLFGVAVILITEAALEGVCYATGPRRREAEPRGPAGVGEGASLVGAQEWWPSKCRLGACGAHAAPGVLFHQDQGAVPWARLGGMGRGALGHWECSPPHPPQTPQPEPEQSEAALSPQEAWAPGASRLGHTFPLLPAWG